MKYSHYQTVTWSSRHY